MVALIVVEVRFYGTGFAGKTLWDWLQLLFVPAALTAFGFLLNYRERNAAERRAEKERKEEESRTSNEQKAADRHAEEELKIEQHRSETEQEIASDNQRETALQAYINEMSELLLHENLRESDPEKEVRKIARVRTLTVLPRLDSQRKGTVLKFLIEAGLIGNYNIVVDIVGADLSDTFIGLVNFAGANLRFVNFTGAVLDATTLVRADLMGAILKGADLEGADLEGANLQYADLEGADLTEANLKGIVGITVESLKKQAISLKGATMPDGTKHP